MIQLLPSHASGAVRDALLREMNSEPLIRKAAVAVAAEDGLVTLTGCVGSRGAKVAAERAAKCIPGVRIIANDIDVTGPGTRSDIDIARHALHCLRENLSVPPSVQAVVCDGLITLDGTVGGMNQRLAAECAVKYIHGVKGVNNDITVQVPPRLPVQTPVEGKASWHA